MKRIKMVECGNCDCAKVYIFDMKFEIINILSFGFLIIIRIYSLGLASRFWENLLLAFIGL